MVFIITYVKKINYGFVIITYILIIIHKVSFLDGESDTSQVGMVGFNNSPQVRGLCMTLYKMCIRVETGLGQSQSAYLGQMCYFFSSPCGLLGQAQSIWIGNSSHIVQNFDKGKV